MQFLKIHFVVHVVSGHHDDFLIRNWIRIVVIDEHAIYDTITQRLYFCLIPLSQFIITLRVELIHCRIWFFVMLESVARCFILDLVLYYEWIFLGFKLLTLIIDFSFFDSFQLINDFMICKVKMYDQQKMNWNDFFTLKNLLKLNQWFQQISSSISSFLI